MGNRVMHIESKRADIIRDIRVTLASLVSLKEQAHEIRVYQSLSDRLRSDKDLQLAQDTEKYLEGLGGRDYILDLALEGLLATIATKECRIGKLMAEAAVYGVELVNFEIDPQYLMAEAREELAARKAQADDSTPSVKIIKLIRDMQDRVNADRLDASAERGSASHAALRLSGATNILAALMLNLEQEGLA